MDAVETYMDAAAAALDLHIAPECRAGVIGYLRLAAAMAERLQVVSLTPADESGSVFVPVAPAGSDTPEDSA
jgi:hypothetical protein